jgi:dihydropteridine reductase
LKSHALPFRAIICTAGGWVGGGAGDATFPSAFDDMNSKCVQPALLSSSLACTPGVLEPGGLLILTGSAAAFQPTPTMVAYGLAKAATHALARSLGAPGSGLPLNAVALAMAPHVIDTPGNRKWMAEGADVSTWTPPETIAQMCGEWVTGATTPPPSGSVVEVVTAPGGKTAWITRA